jgi:hypothetical protein
MTWRPRGCLLSACSPDPATVWPSTRLWRGLLPLSYIRKTLSGKRIALALACVDSEEPYTIGISIKQTQGRDRLYARSVGSQKFLRTKDRKNFEHRIIDVVACYRCSSCRSASSRMDRLPLSKSRLATDQMSGRSMHRSLDNPMDTIRSSAAVSLTLATAAG